MIFESVKSEGLAHISYFLGDESAGEAIVIDPRRDIEVYLELAKEHGLKITKITETHIHADFVSGSLELAAKTNAEILLPLSGGYEFEHTGIKDGDVIRLGKLLLKVFETPGHTPEHISFLISGGKGAEGPWGLFTGDTIFAGEIGRPDLLGKELEKQLAGQLYDTLHTNILLMGDSVMIFPAHGKGSPCGADIGDRDSSTIGYEKRFNSLLSITGKTEFTEKILSGQQEPPKYYPRMKKVNKKGPEILGGLPHIPALSAEQFREIYQDKNSLILDAREIYSFGGAFIPGSINIGLRKSFPVWAGRILDYEFPVWSGWIIDPDYDIYIVAEESSDLDIIQRHLIRTGYVNIKGYLANGMRSWIEAGYEFKRQIQMSVHELNDQIKKESGLQILDVRSKQEFAEGYIPGAVHTFVPDLVDGESEEKTDPQKPVVVYCGSGYRASIAASILYKKGYEKVFNLAGSMAAWKAAGYDIVQ